MYLFDFITDEIDEAHGSFIGCIVVQGLKNLGMSALYILLTTF